MAQTIYYLAIDIGASGGRHILGHLQQGRLVTEEIYRFENGVREEKGTLIWDIERLEAEIKYGLARCGQLGKIPVSVAIDTWGVDYVLLDDSGRPLLPAVSYRDNRTEAAAAAVAEFLPQSLLYRKTGIQKQNFNTLYQLYCDKQSGKLDRAAHFLMIPDYLAYTLTGVPRNEYTNATTTNLVNAYTRDWDEEILTALGLPRALFSPLSLPGTTVGSFTATVQKEVGYNATVVLCPSHDTAAAVAACPLEENSVYLSSGTWSLIGTELTAPITDDAALQANFTNEGGVDYRYRFLKNIMGMWLFQSIRRELNKAYTYDDMMNMAMNSRYARTIDPTDPRFLAPPDMLSAIRTALGEPDLPPADVLSCLYHSLALSYQKTVAEIEALCRKPIHSIHIVGGGSKDAYLNRLTARYTGKSVYVGLTEATATGNLLSQIMKLEGLSLKEARQLVKNTFPIQEVIV